MRAGGALRPRRAASLANSASCGTYAHSSRRMAARVRHGKKEAETSRERNHVYYARAEIEIS